MIRDGYIVKAQQWFADANGWRVAGHSFSLETLARGGMHGRYDGYLIVDHQECYRKDRRAIAIVGHNYADDGDRSTRYGTIKITRLAAEHGLVVHIAPAGKAASWYYPNGTALLVITRPGISIAWPTQEQMVATAQAHAEHVAEIRARREARERLRASLSPRS